MDWVGGFRKWAFLLRSTPPIAKILSPYLSALDFCNSPVWNIEFDELFFSLFQTWILQQAEKSSSNWEKISVHQTWYFKQENCKNQVQIDRKYVSKCEGKSVLLDDFFLIKKKLCWKYEKLVFSKQLPNGSHNLFHIFSMIFFIEKNYPTKHFCPLIFDIYYFSYRWCGSVLSLCWHSRWVGPKN